MDACPSHAIYLVPSTYAAPQQEKSELVKNKMFTLIASKSVQENLAASIAGDTDNPVVRQLAKALEKSNRIMAEECFREAGFMLPQSQETKELLRGLLDGPQIEDYPKEIIERLLELL